ncbi:MAG: PTS sugar transporter subunit IIB [Micrococcales bacterium]
MKIVAVCGAGMGTSMILKINAEKVLKAIGVEATVDAVSLERAQSQRDAQIILTTKDLAEHLKGLPSEVIVLEQVLDIEELKAKLSRSLL